MSMLRVATSAMLLVLCAALMVGCAKVEIALPHMAPLSKKTRMLLAKKKMTPQAPIFVRIFKAESELEIWKQREDGHFYHLKTYPICHWSGALGPKISQGDKQSPEGFYRVNRHQMNPNSKFHLAFDLGYPNAYDRANGRTGNFLMVHGKCRSAGCYAMTDALIEEIYALAREAFAGGQKAFQVHAMPFRLTPENLARYRGDRNTPFWRSLQKAYDYFEVTRQVPDVRICARRYHVNVTWRGNRRLDPRGACPRFRSGPIVPFVALPSTDASTPARAQGPASVQPQTGQPAQQITAPKPQPASANGTRYYSGLSRMSFAPARASGSPQSPPASGTTTPRRDAIGDLLRK